MTAAPTYLVAGFPRSGTSMLMRCVEAGGLPCVYDLGRDASVRACCPTPGYDPVPHGCFEASDLARLDWPACRGRCVKVVSENLPDLLPAGDYRAAYATRDPAEIAASLPSVMGGPLPPADLDRLGRYWGRVADDVRLLESRGASVVRLHYPDVVADPHAAFARLAAAGWPIDPARAAAVVDPSLYRHRGA